MDQGALLVAVSGALVVVVCAWAAREVVGGARRRRAEREAEQAAPTSDLLPLLLLPVAALVKSIGRNRRSIESLVGPDGCVSLLFCDIEGSTTINRRLGDDAWVRILRAHDEVVARTVRRHRGTVVKTQGDGFMAAFRTPAQAVSAAVELGPALEVCEGVAVPLAVRVGVHAGTVVADKDDLFGTNVTMAARIAAAARGDEVLVSEAVRQELDGTCGLSFRRHRALRLKGLPGRHRVYAVTAG
jgi:class 3 adenylate cyclase